MYQEEERARLSRRLAALGAVLIALGIALLLAEGRAAATTAQDTALVSADCKLRQRIEYTRCAHSVLRRIDAPPEWAGKTHEGVRRALAQSAEGWRMTAFSPVSIEMTCALNLFCPQHCVLMLDDDGVPALWQNRLGFAMEKLETIPVTSLDETSRAQLTAGVMFDSRQEALAWIEQPGEG